MSPFHMSDELEELLTLRVLEGLASGDERELEALLSESPEVDPEDWERGASGLHLALATEPSEPVPAALRERLRADAQRELNSAPALRPLPRTAPIQDPPDAPRGSWNSAWLAWGIAAAALFVIALQFAGRGTASLEQQYRDLVAAADVVRTEWSPGDDPLAAGVTGDVVWSPAEQRGFMRFRALEPNDPTEAQYQLWIFDGTRPAETPVDGGVFDVVDGEVIVPIDAKIDVRDATLFAITLEEPGGVVVSKRERLLLLGPVE